MLYGIENEVRDENCKIRKPSKHAENQYTLIRTDDGRFFALFKDGEGKEQMCEIAEELYQEMLQQAREDEAYLRWNRRHLDDNSDPDVFETARGEICPHSLEETVIRAILISDLLQSLPDVQRRRLEMKYLQNMSLEQIAIKEGCSFVAVKYCIDIALNALRKKFSSET